MNAMEQLLSRYLRTDGFLPTSCSTGRQVNEILEDGTTTTHAALALIQVIAREDQCLLKKTCFDCELGVQLLEEDLVRDFGGVLSVDGVYSLTRAWASEGPDRQYSQLCEKGKAITQWGMEIPECAAKLSCLHCHVSVEHIAANLLEVLEYGWACDRGKEFRELSGLLP